MKKATKKDLQTLEIELTENGFTVWIVGELYPNKIRQRHWLIDASELKEDGKIRFDTGCVQWKHNVICKPLNPNKFFDEGHLLITQVSLKEYLKKVNDLKKDLKKKKK